MGETKNVKAKVKFKHELEKDWLLSSYVPGESELVVYDAETGNNLPEGRDTPYEYPRFKVGDGTTNVNELPFAAQADLTGYATEEYVDSKTQGYFNVAGEQHDDPGRLKLSVLQYNDGSGSMDTAVVFDADYDGWNDEGSVTIGPGSNNITIERSMDGGELKSSVEISSDSLLYNGEQLATEKYVDEKIGDSLILNPESNQIVTQEYYQTTTYIDRWGYIAYPDEWYEFSIPVKVIPIDGSFAPFSTTLQAEYYYDCGAEYSCINITNYLPITYGTDCILQAVGLPDDGGYFDWEKSSGEEVNNIIMGGSNNKVSAATTILFGNNLKYASESNSVVLGDYNEDVPGKYLTIGGGISDNQRKNIFSVSKTGVVTATGTPSNNNDLINIGYLKNQIADNLSSTSRINPLSANQGRVLNNNINTHKNDSSIHVTQEEKNKWNSMANTSEERIYIPDWSDDCSNGYFDIDGDKASEKYLYDGYTEAEGSWLGSGNGMYISLPWGPDNIYTYYININTNYYDVYADSSSWFNIYHAYTVAENSAPALYIDIEKTTNRHGCCFYTITIYTQDRSPYGAVQA